MRAREREAVVATRARKALYLGMLSQRRVGIQQVSDVKQLGVSLGDLGFDTWATHTTTTSTTS